MTIETEKIRYESPKRRDILIVGGVAAALIVPATVAVINTLEAKAEGETSSREYVVTMFLHDHMGYPYGKVSETGEQNNEINAIYVPDTPGAQPCSLAYNQIEGDNSDVDTSSIVIDCGK